MIYDFNEMALQVATDHLDRDYLVVDKESQLLSLHRAIFKLMLEAYNLGRSEKIKGLGE